MEKFHRNVFSALLGLVFCLVLTLGFSFVASAEEFSADIVNRAGKTTTQAKIFVSGDKMRMEMAESITINRNDKKVSWVIMPSEKMYMETPLGALMTPQISKNFNGEIERTSLGQDAVDGVPAEKFKVSYAQGQNTSEVYQWITNTEIPIKTEAVDGSWSTEYNNISTNPQPPELFEIPDGYKQMPMPSFDQREEE